MSELEIEGTGAVGAAAGPGDAKAVSPASPHTAIEQLPPDGADLLDRCLLLVNRFVCLPSENAAFAVVLWAASTHMMDAWETTPRLAFLSAEPGSGKSRAMAITALLCPLALEAANATTASLVRALDDPAGRPVIFIDEIDTKYGPKAKGDEELRCVINAGHRRGGFFLRCEKGDDGWVPIRQDSFAAIAMAGIGDILPDSVVTRSIIVRMRKRLAGETVDAYRQRDHMHLGKALCDELAIWADHVREHAATCRPPLPDRIADRDADVWEPLIVVADLAGGPWPERARQAAVEFVQSTKASQKLSLGAKLLADIRDCFGDSDRIATADLLSKLRAIEVSPWGGSGRNRLDAHTLAQMLGEYGIRPTTIRLAGPSGSVLKGYKRADFLDAWARYLPSSILDETGVTSVTEPEG
jgi:hypothetical protein